MIRTEQKVARIGNLLSNLHGEFTRCQSRSFQTFCQAFLPDSLKQAIRTNTELPRCAKSAQACAGILEFCEPCNVAWHCVTSFQEHGYAKVDFCLFQIGIFKKAHAGISMHLHCDFQVSVSCLAANGSETGMICSVSTHCEQNSQELLWRARLVEHCQNASRACR